MIKKQLVHRALIGTILTLPLAACGGGGGRTDTVVEPPKVVVTAQEDKFGIPFGTDFRAMMNSDPASVSDTDIVAVSFTTEPIDITP